jgi:hypothetical protein
LREGLRHLQVLLHHRQIMLIEPARVRIHPALRFHLEELHRNLAFTPRSILSWNVSQTFPASASGLTPQLSDCLEISKADGGLSRYRPEGFRHPEREGRRAQVPYVRRKSVDDP